MDGALVGVCAVLGLVLGPFLDRVVERVPARRSLRGGPYRLGGASLALGVAAAGLFALAAWFAVGDDRWGSSWVVLPYLVVFAALLAVSVVDVRELRIPDRIVFPSLGLALALVVVISLAEGAPRAVVNALVGAALYFVLLLVPHLVYPKGMGFGDVKLGLVMGLALGWVFLDVADSISLVLWALLIGSLLGVVGGVAVAVARRRRGAFPFGPALAASCVVAVAFSGDLVG